MTLGEHTIYIHLEISKKYRQWQTQFRQNIELVSVDRDRTVRAVTVAVQEGNPNELLPTGNSRGEDGDPTEC